MQNYHSAWINKGIDRLSSFFKKNTNEEQRLEYLDAIGDMCSNQGIFKEMIDKIIETNKYFPTIREIKNVYREIRDGKYRTGELRANQITDCKLCGGYGVVTVTKDTNEYAYACKCKAGDNQNLPRYNMHPLKYEADIKLMDKEKKIYEYLKRFGAKKLIQRTADLCPF